MSQNVKTLQGVAIASVKTVQGVAIANVKTIQGVDNTSSGGGFVAGDYGTVLAWYRAEDIAGSDNDPVSAWSDNGANSYDLSQGNATLQPTLQTNQINGFNAVRFDGTNDILTYFGTIGNCGTVIAVLGNVTYSSANAVVGPEGGGTAKRLITFFPDATTIYGGDGSEFWGGSTPTRVNGVSTNTFPGSGGYGVVAQSGTPTALVTGSNSLYIGNSTVNDAYNGDLVEIVFYTTTISTTNQDNAAAALMTKYGL